MKKIFETEVEMNMLTSEVESGKVCIYPTETCYGIGCDALDNMAVQKVFAIKKRDPQKPCILLFKDIEMLKQYAVLNPDVEQKIKPYWPGALTVTLPVQKDTHLSHLVISSLEKIACRISPHPFIQRLFETLSHPLVSTSANLAGLPAIYTSEEIVQTFGNGNENSPDFFIDAGNLPLTPPSTIIDIEGNIITVIRQGDIKIS